jgi:hypothetical protein
MCEEGEARIKRELSSERGPGNTRRSKGQSSFGRRKPSCVIANSPATSSSTFRRLVMLLLSSPGPAGCGIWEEGPGKRMEGSKQGRACIEETERYGDTDGSGYHVGYGSPTRGPCFFPRENAIRHSPTFPAPPLPAFVSLTHFDS